MGKMALDRHCYSTFVVATKHQIATKQQKCYILPFCCYSVMCFCFRAVLLRVRCVDILRDGGVIVRPYT